MKGMIFMEKVIKRLYELLTLIIDANEQELDMIGQELDTIEKILKK